MKKVIGGVIFLLAIYGPIILAALGFDPFQCHLDNSNAGNLFLLTFLSGLLICDGIDDFIDDKFNPWLN